MNKTGLINKIAESAEISKKTAGDALQGFINAVTDTLEKEGKLSLTGFGTFSVAERSARTGRNPMSGESMEIPAKKVVKFKVGSKLAETVK